MASIACRAARVGGPLALTLVLGGAGVVRVAGADTTTAPSVTVAVTPFRILDTRNGTGTGGAIGPVGSGQTVTLQVAGVGTVPLGASGAVLNITATEGTEASFVSAWPTGDTQPNASILNVNVGQNLPNMVTVALSPDGRLNLFNFAGSVHLIADLAGYLVPGSGGTGPAGPQGPPGPTGIPPQQTLQIGAYASSLPDSADTLTGGCVNLEGGVNDFVRLDLSLPLGAQITAVRVRYQDTSATAALAASVHFVDFSPGTIHDDIVAPAVSSAPPPVVGLLNLNLGGGPPPVSATRIYYVNVNVAATALPGFTRFCGAAVDYTLT